MTEREALKNFIQMGGDLIGLAQNVANQAAIELAKMFPDVARETPEVIGLTAKAVVKKVIADIAYGTK